jgi:hypothetical protein
LLAAVAVMEVLVAHRFWRAIQEERERGMSAKADALPQRDARHFEDVAELERQARTLREEIATRHF